MTDISDELSLELRKEVIEKTIEIIRSHYVFPEKGEQIAKVLQEREKNGKYDGLQTVSAFSQTLRKDLHEISQDGHLGVFYWPDKAERLRNISEEEADPEEWYRHYQGRNHGLVEARYLTGNVGYLDIRIFAPLSKAKQPAISMMRYISNCDALIVDLRENLGGDPYLVQLIESYFFEGQPKLLLTFFKRTSESYEQIYTIPALPGKRLSTIPLYILTSRTTFSGGEDFSYTLKNHGRAVIVGENTRGGAHSIDERFVCDNFVMHIPSGYPIHPETNSNWEAVGVEPDIPVSRENALSVAHIHAIETLIEREESEEKKRRHRFDLEKVKTMYSPAEVTDGILSNYLGKYRDYNVELQDSTLHIMMREEGIAWKLVPMGEGCFVIENDDEYNVRFDTDASGDVNALVFIHWNRDRESRIAKLA